MNVRKGPREESKLLARSSRIRYSLIKKNTMIKYKKNQKNIKKTNKISKMLRKIIDKHF